MANQHSGRKVAVGLAPEATRGTAAASATHWLAHTSADFYDRQDYLDNESAMGVDEKINDSEIASRWADGSVEGKIRADSFGLALVGMFGQPTTTTLDTGIYQHVFEFSDTLGALTLFRKDKVSDKKFARVTFSSMEIAAAAKEWVTFNCEATAMKGATASSTVAYLEDEPEFSGKNVVVKTADDEAGLASADRMILKNITSTISRAVEPYYGLGNEEPDEIDSDEIEFGGSFALRYGNQDVENVWKENKKQWMSILMENANVDLGDGTHPSLEIQYPKVSIRELALSTELASKVDQSYNFIPEYSATEGRSIRVTLVNSTASYAA